MFHGVGRKLAQNQSIVVDGDNTSLLVRVHNVAALVEVVENNSQLVDIITQSVQMKRLQNTQNNVGEAQQLLGQFQLGFVLQRQNHISKLSVHVLQHLFAGDVCVASNRPRYKLLKLLIVENLTLFEHMRTTSKQQFCLGHSTSK